MINKFKFFLLGSFSTLFALIFIFLIFGKDKIRDSYLIFQINLKKVFEKEKVFFDKDFNKCLPKLISYVPENSSIIIGHAYGRSSFELQRNTMSPKIDRFLKSNRESISNLFLTGDIFRVPSYYRWKSLYDEFEDYFDIYISPGNHDVDLFGLSKDVFDLYVGTKQPIKFPFVLKKSGFKIVVDDSNKDKTILDLNKKQLKIFQNNEQDIIFLRHHVLLDKLFQYGGDMNGHNFYKESVFEKKLNSKNKIYFVYGNGGQDANAPRIACYEHDNFIHLLNGIGDFNTDNILILNNGKLFRYILPN